MGNDQFADGEGVDAVPSPPPGQRARVRGRAGRGKRAFMNRSG
jgi:hypothetical protein